jgi:hypothetical protein
MRLLQSVLSCLKQTKKPQHGSVHMTQDTCGKQVLPTSPSACT